MAHPSTLEEAENRIRAGHERAGGGKGGGLLSLFRRGGGGDKESEARGQYNVATEHMNKGYQDAQVALDKIRALDVEVPYIGKVHGDSKEVASLIRKAGMAIIRGARGEVGQDLALASKLNINATPTEISRALRAIENEMTNKVADPGGSEAGRLTIEMGTELQRLERRMDGGFDHEEYMKKDGRAQEAYCRDHGQYPDGKPYRVASGVTTTKTSFGGRLFGGGTSGGETSSAWNDWGNGKM